MQVMASLAEKEGLRGQVQCIYLDPPYGIKFNSNWQVSTRSKDVKDGKVDQISREPEQVKAFRDTWKNGINSYLTYLRDRLTVARDLLHESGSIFVQIGDENVHLLRSLLGELFGEENFVSQIAAAKTSGLASSDALASSHDYVLHYAKRKEIMKFRELFVPKLEETDSSTEYFSIQLSDGTRRRMTSEEREKPSLLPPDARVFRVDNLTKPGPGARYDFRHNGELYTARARWWGTPFDGMVHVQRAARIQQGGTTINFVRFLEDFSVKPITNYWRDVILSSRVEDKIYIVQTSVKLVQRCILMATDPGDLVLDPTCGSGTTATVAEQWGRRWITIDTSRVALALARSRVMGARYPYYLLADSPEGQRKEAEVTRSVPKDTPTQGDIRQGFVCERVPHITLKSIANNAEIGVIWERWQTTLEPLRTNLNAVIGKTWEEWQIPRDAGDPWPRAAAETWTGLQTFKNQPGDAAKLLRQLNEQLGRTYTLDAVPDSPRDPWPSEPTALHADWWKARIARQREIDTPIAARAEFETLHDKPYTDPGRVRVAGPFTVESLSPHRIVPTDDDELWDDVVAAEAADAGRPTPKRTRGPQHREKTDFAQVVLDHLKTSGVHQMRKEDRITFTSIAAWPGTYIAAEARFMEAETERRAAIFIGPEFGTVARPDMIAAAREAAEAGFPLLIACAFNFDAHASEFSKLGPVQVIRARMNPDLHMADDLKNTGSGNLFVVFGEPDVEITKLLDNQVQVRIAGLDIFDPSKGEVRAGGTEDIAAWFIDTDYDEESFFVRHAYFLGANDPYKALKTTLKAEIDEEAWESLYRDTSRPFPRPEHGRIAVKVINHFGDEVMKVFSV
jgi:adenine-specific DNA-methyltransferase